jgi:hypothetical protein
VGDDDALTQGFLQHPQQLLQDGVLSGLAANLEETIKYRFQVYSHKEGVLISVKNLKYSECISIEDLT